MYSEQANSKFLVERERERERERKREREREQNESSRYDRLNIIHVVLIILVGISVQTEERSRGSVVVDYCDGRENVELECAASVRAGLLRNGLDERLHEQVAVIKRSCGRLVRLWDRLQSGIGRGELLLCLRRGLPVDERGDDVLIGGRVETLRAGRGASARGRRERRRVLRRLGLHAVAAQLLSGVQLRRREAQEALHTSGTREE